MNTGLLTGLGMIAPTRYVTDVGDGLATTITVSHGLGTQDVEVFVRRNISPFEQIQPDVQVTDCNNVKLFFAFAPAARQYRVIISRN
jgi:hypothetical protein